MSHQCAWRSKTVWQEAPDAPEGWQISQQVRLRVCPECGQQQQGNAILLGQRRQQRRVLLPGLAEPATLRSAIPLRQWGSIADIVTKLPGNRLEVEEQLQTWLVDGWLEVEERQEKYRQQWQPVKVRLSTAAYDRLVVQPEQKQQSAANAEIAGLLQLLAGWEADVVQARQVWAGDKAKTAVLDRIAAILPPQIAALQQGRWQPLPDTNQQTGGPVQRRWLRILRGLAALLSGAEAVYERTFAAQWLADSKGLIRERRPFADYLGIEWEQLGLYRHTPVALCWGDFVGNFAGYALNGRAGSPFVALAAETVKELEVISLQARALLIVENQTAFEALLQPNLRQDDLLYLFGSGHAGYTERALVKLWLNVQPHLPWYVWTDWDVGGVRIQMDWAQWAEQQRLSLPTPWLWQDETFIQWREWGRPLAPESLRALEALQQPLADKLIEVGYTMEQEAILAELNNAYLRRIKGWR